MIRKFVCSSGDLEQSGVSLDVLRMDDSAVLRITDVNKNVSSVITLNEKDTETLTTELAFGMISWAPIVEDLLVIEFTNYRASHDLTIFAHAHRIPVDRFDMKALQVENIEVVLKIAGINENPIAKDHFIEAWQKIIFSGNIEPHNARERCRAYVEKIVEYKKRNF